MCAIDRDRNALGELEASVPMFRVDRQESMIRGAAVLALKGDLGANGCPLLARAVDEALAPGAVDRLILDGNALEAIDAAGLRALIGAARRAERHGAVFTLLPAPPTAPVLQITADGQIYGVPHPEDIVG
jgi:anti-anti-sigma factor